MAVIPRYRDFRLLSFHCIESRTNGIRNPIFRTQEQNVSRFGKVGGCPVRHFPSRRDATRKVKGDGAFAQSGVALKNGYLAQRYATRPEPPHGLWLDLIE